MARTKGASRASPRPPYRYLRRPRAPERQRLFSATDNGGPTTIPPEPFAPPSREPGWGPCAEPFIRLNRAALAALDARFEVAAASGGTSVRILPGGRVGAVPLRSAQTGHVAGGVIVKPRFDWAGIGQILVETGWAASPEFLELPLVPGSGREVPPWVLAGPVLARIEALLRSLRRGYRQEEAVLRHPRGRILWPRYLSESLTRGQWERLPCRFPDLGQDPLLRRHARWVLERVRADLLAVGGTDPVAVSLATAALKLIEPLADVIPLAPSREVLKFTLGGSRLVDVVVRRGIFAWVVEERGLGGGRELDGLAWSLPLDRLGEAYVEGLVHHEAALTGGEVRVGRLGQTTFPLEWSDPTHRSLGDLVPDIVVRRGRSVRIVDAKYKAHLAELDEVGWHRFTEEAREQHRADLHQVLAYAALYDADEIAAELVYPLRPRTWRELRERGRELSSARLEHKGRTLAVLLRGEAFGRDTLRAWDQHGEVREAPGWKPAEHWTTDVPSV